MAASSWWVVQSTVPSRSQGSVPVQTVVQGVKRPPNAVAGPFDSGPAAYKWINQDQTKIPNPISAVSNAANGWLKGLGGQLASGIEQSFVSGLTDLYDVIIGPIQIVIGVIFIVIAFVIFFKDDIMNGIRALGGLAISGAAAAA